MNRTRAPGHLPALPRPRKLWGVATTVDGVPAIYTEVDLIAYGQACYAAGKTEGAAVRKAASAPARPKKQPAEADSHHDAIQAEETAWADFRAGRGPRPVRR